MRFPRLALASLALLAAGCIYAPIDLGLQDLGKVYEVTLVDSDADDKVLLLRVDGEITDYADERDGLLEAVESTVSRVRDALELAEKDRNVKALIVRVNSPGGGVTASDIIYREIAAWKQKTGRPAVALLMDVAASGGYYVAQACDRIVAHPTSITGSIGVLAMLPNLHGLGQKIGVEVHVIKSGPMKDMGNPFRPFGPEERKVFQQLIDDMYARFVDVVVEGRRRAGAGLTREQILRLADGRVFTAADAKKARLVDEVGYFPDALAAALALAKARDAKVVTYERKGIGTGRHTVYSEARPIPAAVQLLGGGPRRIELNLLNLDSARARRPIFNYLWLPGPFAEE